jgi:hypothetical protein
MDPRESFEATEYLVLKPVETYSGAAYPYVPITRVVTCVSDPSGPIFASPKSDNLAVKS